ncbi:hypothetical protein KPL70_001000 [Citrus sinensis]|nr:hypothetical protein KPL70_001000 [Citrus sinensis]
MTTKELKQIWNSAVAVATIAVVVVVADKFLMKYFPPTKNAKLRNEITSFHQLEDESLCDAWERFNELLRRCPHHGIPCCIQLETFYNGLNQSTRLMVDASANEALLSKSYNKAYEILERIANNNYQWPSTRQVAAREHQEFITTKTIYIQTLTNLDGDSTQTFHGVIRTRLLLHLVDRTDLLNHLDFSSKIKSKKASTMINSAPLKLATALSNIPQGSLPSNTEDPRREGKEHCKVINLRSGKDVYSPVGAPKRKIESTQSQEDTQVEKKSQSSTFQNANQYSSTTASAESYDPAPGGEEATTPTATNLSRAKEKQSAQPATAQQFRHPPPFLQRFQKQQQDKQFNKILGVLKQLHINIHFVEVLEQMPNYAKFLKDILTKKRRLREFETVALTQKYKEVSIILGRPFLATGKTLIDVQKGELTMRVNDQQVTFNMLDAMKSPDKIEDCNFISVVDFVVTEKLHSCCSKEEINVVTLKELDGEDHGAANIAWSREKQPFRIDEQIQQRELTPYQQEFKANGPRVKHYMGNDVNSLRKDMLLNDPC